jgi:hypothetical protein
MNVVDHRLDYRLALLQGQLARPNRASKAPLDHRVDCLCLPPLSIYPVQPRLGYQLGTRLASWSYHFGWSPASWSGSTTDRGYYVQPLYYPATIEPRVSQQQPFPSSTTPIAPVSPVLASLSTQPGQVSGIVGGPSPGKPPYNQLGPGAHRIAAFDVPAEDMPTPRLVVGTGSGEVKAGAVHRDYALTPLDTQLLQEQALHLVEVSHPHLLDKYETR